MLLRPDWAVKPLLRTRSGILDDDRGAVSDNSTGKYVADRRRGQCASVAAGEPRARIGREMGAVFVQQKHSASIPLGHAENTPERLFKQFGEVK